ncbi:hypothetical protein QW71_17350 [Paenibacillus sp. IHB B 3415]|nr:hypothetical protein QW71_17350 [Paenibacillus sp. IHB B 3415]
MHLFKHKEWNHCIKRKLVRFIFLGFSKQPWHPALIAGVTDDMTKLMEKDLSLLYVFITSVDKDDFILIFAKWAIVVVLFFFCYKSSHTMK